MALHKFNEWQIDLKFYKSAKTSAAHRHIAPVGPVSKILSARPSTEAPLLFERIVLVNHFEDARRRVEPKMRMKND
jgi:hypothetical protein